VTKTTTCSSSDSSCDFCLTLTVVLIGSASACTSLKYQPCQQTITVDATVGGKEIAGFPTTKTIQNPTNIGYKFSAGLTCYINLVLNNVKMTSTYLTTDVGYAGGCTIVGRDVNFADGTFGTYTIGRESVCTPAVACANCTSINGCGWCTSSNKCLEVTDSNLNCLCAERNNSFVTSKTLCANGSNLKWSFLIWLVALMATFL